MRGSLIEVKRVEPVEGIPDGRYQGIWSGYTVKFDTPYGSYEAKSRTGVRGTTTCAVVVECGKLEVTSE